MSLLKGLSPVHPGKILLEECITPLNMSINQVSKALKVSPSTLSRITSQKSAVSPEMAIRLAKAFNTTPAFWLNLQQAYDLAVWQEKINIDEVKQLTNTDLQTA